MKVKVLILFLVCMTLVACESHTDEDLRAVPVTNNPNIIPKTGQTAYMGN